MGSESPRTPPRSLTHEEAPMEHLTSIGSVERAIRVMESNDICLHPRHLHSFRQVNFLLPNLLSSSSYSIMSAPSHWLGLGSHRRPKQTEDKATTASITAFLATNDRTCCVTGCTRPIPAWNIPGLSSSFTSKVDNSNQSHEPQLFVRCLACGAVAHRKCAFQTPSNDLSMPMLWQVCPVNAARLRAAENTSDHPSIDLSDNPMNDQFHLDTSWNELTTDEISPSEPVNEIQSTNVDAIIVSEEDESGIDIDYQSLPMLPKVSSMASTVSSDNATDIANDVSLDFPSEYDILRHSVHDAVDTPMIVSQPFDLVSTTVESQAQEETFESSVEEQKSYQQDTISSPFAAISRALQENIHAHFSKHNARANGEANGDTTAPNDMDKFQQQPMHPIARFATGTVGRIGAVAVIGGLAGGVAGMVLAGPMGAFTGYQLGSKAGALGVVVEGSVGIGVILASVVTGAQTAQHVQHQLQQHDERRRQQRLLTMGEEGTSQKLILVRQGIIIDPIWDEIVTQAMKAPDAVNTTVTSVNLYPASEAARLRQRYRRDADIVNVTENELPINEKVLLLVSRILNDKTRLPGHVYRLLISAFHGRVSAIEEPVHVNTANGSATASNSSSLHQERTVDVCELSRHRRDDAHAVIKHVTATLLDVRPDLGATPVLTELSIMSIESIVFGQIYGLVFDEIKWEARALDEALVFKISNFHDRRLSIANNRRSQALVAEGYEEIQAPSGIDNLGSMCLSTNDSMLEPFLSDPALRALRMLSGSHSVIDKLECCVRFLECISIHSDAKLQKSPSGYSGFMGLNADSLLHVCCQHIVYANVPFINAEISFVEEYATDEQLLRGREGYSLVTLQASLHYLNMASTDLSRDVFGCVDSCEHSDASTTTNENANGETLKFSLDELVNYPELACIDHDEFDEEFEDFISNREQDS
jgi:hypothetical protein